MEAVNISISENDLNYAQAICSHITGADKRERAMTNVIGARIASGFFSSQDYAADEESGIHNFAPIIETFDISDLYVNNTYIDVRVYFSDDEIKIPEIHFKTGILPAAYMFIKLDENLRNAEVTGFILPQHVNISNSYFGMIKIYESDLRTFEQIKSVLKDTKEDTESAAEEIYEFLDGALEPKEIVNLFKHLTHSKQDRQKLLKAVKAKTVFNFVSNINTANQADTGITISDAIDTTASDVAIEDNFNDLLNETDLNNSDTANSSFEYTTEITPSSAELIESLNEQSLEASDRISDSEPEAETKTGAETEPEENSEDIEALFNDEPKKVPVGKKRNSLLPLILLVFILLLSGGFYWWYTNMYNQPSDMPEDRNTAVTVNSNNNIEKNEEKDVMPLETVENNNVKIAPEKNTSVAVSTIEKNLDSSILVTNLKVSWELPAGYVANTATKRYLIRLGKRIQFNLKTELLLLNRPPLANKINVELTYNSLTEKFDVVGIKDSSGEKTVDDAILKAIKEALDYKINSDIVSFAKAQGNPIIVIRL